MVAGTEMYLTEVCGDRDGGKGSLGTMDRWLEKSGCQPTDADCSRQRWLVLLRLA